MSKLVVLTKNSGARVAINTHQVRYIRDKRNETSTIVFDTNQTFLVNAKYELACSVLAPGLTST